MAQGPHIHDWHHGEVEQVKVLGYIAKRYCKTCSKLEIISLSAY